MRLIASLHAGTGDVQIVDVRNAGALPGLPDDAVVEIPCTVDRAGAHPLPQRELPSDMAGLVAHCKAYERLAVEAARTGSRQTMIRALVANPLVGQYPLAERLADTLLEANRRFLPRFFPRRLTKWAPGLPLVGLGGRPVGSNELRPPIATGLAFPPLSRSLTPGGHPP